MNTNTIYDYTSLNSSQNEKCSRQIEKTETHNFSTTTIFWNRAVYEIMWKTTAERSWQYGPHALHAGWLRLPTYTYTHKL